MVVEILGSIGIGLLSGSLALLAFGGDSLIEIMSGLAVTLHLRNDSSGSNGLGERAEKLTKFLLVALIPTIGGGAVYSYLARIKPESSLLGIAVALGAVIIMPILWVQKSRIGRETKCAPLSMDAVQSATCFLMSLALLGGLLINYLFGIGWVDYVAAAVILVFVARESMEAFRGLNPVPPNSRHRQDPQVDDAKLPEPR
jgi:divalent metal cation (Fe/Co/Zn/Cd) transporter